MDVDSSDTQFDRDTETDAQRPWHLSLPLSPSESQDTSESSASSLLDDTPSDDDEDEVVDAVSISTNSEGTSESSVPPTPSPPSLAQGSSCPASAAEFKEYDMWEGQSLNLFHVVQSIIRPRVSRSNSTLSCVPSDGSASPVGLWPSPTRPFCEEGLSFMPNADVYGGAGRPRFRPSRRGTSTSEAANGGPNYCVFCRNNGEPPVLYNAHRIKDSRGKVTCPVLFAYTCPNCNAFGEDAHTIKYCPLNQTPEAQQAQAAANRHPEGASHSTHFYNGLHTASGSTLRPGRLRERPSSVTSMTPVSSGRVYNGEAGDGAVRGSLLMSALEPTFNSGLSNSFATGRRRH